MAVTNARTEVRVRYATTPTGFPAMSHWHTFDVYTTSTPIAGTPFADIQVVTKGGSFLDLDTYLLDTYLPLVYDLYTNTADFSYAELWYYPANEDNASYISTELIGEVGDSANPTVVANYSMVSFRSINGNVMKLQYMETVLNSAIRDSFPIQNAAVSAIATHVVDDLCPIVNIRRSYANAPIAGSYGQHEILFNKRYRS